MAEDLGRLPEMSKWIRSNSVAVIYAVLFLITALPILSPLGLPISIGPTTRKFASIIDSLKKDDIVFVDINFSPGSWAENGPQLAVIMKHLWTKGVKVLFFSLAVDGPQMYMKAIGQATPPPSLKYGVDWVYLGYLSGAETAAAAITKDTWSLVKSDYFGTPLQNLPIMQKIRTAEDAQLLIVVTSGEMSWMWVRQWYERYRKTYLLAPISIMVPSGAPYQQAGQIAAILAGSRGAAEYEVLIAKPGEGATVTDALTMQLLYLMCLIIIGNVIFYTQRKGRRTSATGGI